jgi:ketosteroid isomerase-like protein
VEIEQLIRRWAAAAHSGDLDAIVAEHDDDIVMFDVPPPHDGVRGLSAYRDTWPSFFEWQACGASFDIVELEVTEGRDVAFAWTLLKRGSPEGFADEPDRRLRLTVGLRKEGDRWIVVHEHHSFADTSSTPV